jgi:hypothetical protein
MIELEGAVFIAEVDAPPGCLLLDALIDVPAIFVGLPIFLVHIDHILVGEAVLER